MRQRKKGLRLRKPARAASAGSRKKGQGRLTVYEKKLRSVYLGLIALSLVFIILFAFLIRGKLARMIGADEPGERPEYEEFPYHTLPDWEEDETDQTLDPEEFEISGLPPLPVVPAPPPVGGALTTRATTTTATSSPTIEQSTGPASSPSESAPGSGPTEITETTNTEPSETQGDGPTSETNIGGDTGGEEPDPEGPEEEEEQ